MSNVIDLGLPRDRYGHSIDTLMPQATGRERELRCSLMLARDRANAGLNHCCAEAYPILVVIADLAGRHVFVPMPLEVLEALRYQVIRLATCAAGLETLFGAPPPDDGSPDACA